MLAGTTVPKGVGDLLEFSWVSLALYGINVAIIYLVGLLFYKIKGFAPVAKSAFWEVLFKDNN